MNEPKNIKMESKTFIVPKSNLQLGATDNLYLGVIKRISGKMTFVYTLVSKRDDFNRYPIIPETTVAAFNNPDKADIYHKTIVDIMRWQSTSYLQKIRQYFRESAADFYRRNR